MADHEDTGGDETYEMRSERLRGLPLGEVNERLDALAVEFGQIVGRYSGRISRFRRNLGPEDLDTLSQAVGDLLPLGMNHAVQGEVLASDPQADTSSLAFYRASSLMADITYFMARFENTGVTFAE